MFLYMYLIGLLVGLVIYGLTFLFAKKINNSARVIVVYITGVVTFLASIFVIGGFEGMPFGVLSLGIFTVAIITGLFVLVVSRKK